MPAPRAGCHRYLVLDRSEPFLRGWLKVAPSVQPPPTGVW
jgi:hypothetical protein